MPAANTSHISNNESTFILKALREGNRADGRRRFDFRPVEYKLAEDDSGAEVRLGCTRAITTITAELSTPYGDRSNEGRVIYNVYLSPLASPTLDPARSGGAAQAATAQLERALQNTGAVDKEALCVIAGRKVWTIRVDVHVTAADGNVSDAVVLSALAALLAFRCPAVSLGGPDDSQIIVHSPDEKESVPLSIHHLPFSITFAVFEQAQNGSNEWAFSVKAGLQLTTRPDSRLISQEDIQIAGQLIAVDPGRSEDAACAAHLNTVVNAHGEVCAVHKADGRPLSADQILHCIRAAVNIVEPLTKDLRHAIDVHEKARVARRVRRHPIKDQNGTSLARATLPS